MNIFGADLAFPQFYKMKDYEKRHKPMAFNTHR